MTHPVKFIGSAPDRRLIGALIRIPRDKPLSAVLAVDDIVFISAPFAQPPVHCSSRVAAIAGITAQPDPWPPAPVDQDFWEATLAIEVTDGFSPGCAMNAVGACANVMPDGTCSGGFQSWRL